MKSFWTKFGALLICASVMFTACESDEDNSGNDSDNNVSECGDVSDSVKDFYEDDAVRLAIQVASQQGGFASSAVEIPDALINRMSDVLGAVHSSEFAARDSVVEVYDVHIYDAYAIDEVVVKISNSDDPANWGKAWIDGKRFTGDPLVDGLMLTYDLTVDGILEFDDEAFVTIKSAQPINVFALVANFNQIEGVLDATTNSKSGDGDNIMVTASGEVDAYKVVYEVAFDDCDNGCKQARLYEFNVNEDCKVVYINTTGDDAPDPDDRD